MSRLHAARPPGAASSVMEPPDQNAIPCDGCTACCKSEQVILRPEAGRRPGVLRLRLCRDAALSRPPDAGAQAEPPHGPLHLFDRRGLLDPRARAGDLPPLPLCADVQGARGRYRAPSAMRCGRWATSSMKRWSSAAATAIGLRATWGSTPRSTSRRRSRRSRTSSPPRRPGGSEQEAARLPPRTWLRTGRARPPPRRCRADRRIASWRSSAG